MLLTKRFFLPSLAFHFGYQEISIVDLIFQFGTEDLHDFFLALIRRESLFKLGLTVQVVIHL